MGTPVNTTRAFVIIATALAAVVAGCATPAARQQPAESGPTPRTQAEALASKAAEAAERGRTDEAIALYEEAIAAYTRLTPAWNNLGVLLLKQSNYYDAADRFRVAAEFAPADPTPVENLALTYHLAGNDREALRYFKMALERDPNSIRALRGVARVANRLHLADQIILEHLNNALMLETDPTWRRVFETERSRVESQLHAREGMRIGG